MQALAIPTDLWHTLRCLLGCALWIGLPLTAGPARFIKVSEPLNCRELRTGEPQDRYRFIRFEAGYELYTRKTAVFKVPDPQGRHASAFLSRAVETTERRPILRPWREAAFIAYVTLLALGGFILLSELLMATMSTRQDRRRRLVRWSIGVPAWLALCVALGYGSGSRLILDNASDASVKVVIDGQPIAYLGASNCADIRIHGASVRLEVFQGNELLESAHLSFDANWGQTIRRALLGRGTFLYNIGAANEYRVVPTYDAEP